MTLDDMLAFGKYIQEKRESVHLRKRDVAEKIEVSYAYYADIEAGRRSAPDKKLYELAQILELSEEETYDMLDLAALTRENQAPIDLPEYLMNQPVCRAVIREAKKRGYGEAFWQETLDGIRRE